MAGFFSRADFEGRSSNWAKHARFLKELFASHDWKARPCRSLYFHIDPIMLSAEQMAGLVEPVWRDAIERVTGYEVTGDTPLVSVTGRDGQTILDRHDVLRYVANQHLHTFNHVKSLRLAKGKKVVMEFKSSDDARPVTFALTQRSFVRTYMIKPMQTFGIQFRGRGLPIGDVILKSILALRQPLFRFPVNPARPTASFLWGIDPHLLLAGFFLSPLRGGR